MNNNKIKETLKKLLFERDLTPPELARRVDIPQQTIQRIIKGKISRPHPKTLNILAEYFGISVTHLKGDDPFEEPNKSLKKSSSEEIGVYTWDKLDELCSNDFVLSTEENIFIGGGYSKKTFGVIMSDSSMAPFFPKNSILIIDPERTANDRSYVIAYLHDIKKYLFRQLLSDGENLFLKALNSDLSSFPIKKLHASDKLIGELVETRQIYAKSLEGKNDA